MIFCLFFFFFFQAEDGIRDWSVTGVQTCALPISQVKAIQEKYKKYSMRDPRKAEMNKEVMAVYSREGINPMGGCFQMFLQMPVWFGLNTALRYAIEMRHATWQIGRASGRERV